MFAKTHARDLGGQRISAESLQRIERQGQPQIDQHESCSSCRSSEARSIARARNFTSEEARRFANLRGKKQIGAEVGDVTHLFGYNLELKWLPNSSMSASMTDRERRGELHLCLEGAVDQLSAAHRLAVGLQEEAAIGQLLGDLTGLRNRLRDQLLNQLGRPVPT